MTSPLTYDTLRHAAHKAVASGHHKDGQKILYRLSDMLGSKYGFNSAEYAEFMHEAADICATQQMWPMAEDGYRRAVAAYRQLDRGFDPCLVIALRNLGDVLRIRGLMEEAAELDRQAGKLLAKRLSKAV